MTARWNDPDISIGKRILILVRDKYEGECPHGYQSIAADIGAKPTVVSAEIARLIKRGRLVRTNYGLVLPK